MPSVIQRTFAGGEIDPALHARADLSKYAAGCKTLRNFTVRKEGAATNRAGFGYVNGVRDDTLANAIPFVFNVDQSYVVILSDNLLTIVQDGDYLRSAGTAWSGATAYTIGDIVSSGGNSYYCIADHTNFVPPNVSYWHPMYGDIISMPAPWDATEVADVQFVQQADTMILLHPSYEARVLRRLSATKWTLSVAEYQPAVDRPNGGTATAGAAGSKSYRYRVTAIDEDQNESLAGCGPSIAISLNRTVSPWVGTATAHGYTTGDQIFLMDVNLDVDAAEFNDRIYTITVTGANTFTFDGTTIGSGAALTRYTARTYVRVNSAAAPTTSAPITVTWPAVVNAARYAVYREVGGVYGFIGYAALGGSTQFEDTNITPDTSSSPPVADFTFRVQDGYPATGAFVQQRLALANRTLTPEQVDLSRVGDYFNFTRSEITNDADAVRFSLAGNQVNPIRHLLELGRLLVFTAAGIWSVEGDSDGVVRPTAINLRQQVYSGSSSLRPLVVVNSALYVQARANIVRDLGFSFQDDGYRSNDLTAYAGHLMRGYTLVDWAYQETPDSIVWIVRSDGALLGLTYIREQEVVAWHRHDTLGGTFERVCVIPENGKDVLYAIVCRTINGTERRYIERMADRLFTDQADLPVLDSFLSYDGTNTTATTITVSWVGFPPIPSVTLTASASLFAIGDVGNEFVITQANGIVVRYTVTVYTSATVVTARPDYAGVPDGTATVAWARAVDQITGLDHLEGQQVSVYAEGSVVSDGTNADYTVTAGTIDLDRPYFKLHIGLPITADLELLDLEDAEAETLSDKRLLINEATLLVESSRPPEVGPDEDHLRPVRGPDPTTQGGAQPLTTGRFTVGLNATWNDNGRVFIRHTDPTPLTILGVVRRGRVETRKS
jgi:hypothetical protein